MSGTFFITDGTDIVHLVSTTAGFNVNEWKPAAASYKNDGEWVDSPLNEGRRPVLAKFANVSDSFSLALSGQNQDIVISLTRALRNIGEKAREYWQSESQVEPVWLVAVGSCETNTRYALVYAINAPSDDNPYAPPFAGEPSAIDEFEVTIEHSPWMDTGTGDSTCLPLNSNGRGFQVARKPFGLAFTHSASCTIPAATYAANTLYLGNNGAIKRSGVMFALDVPKGARILSAFIQFWSRLTLATVTVNITIKAENADNPVAFTTAANLAARTTIANTVAWNNLPAWTINNPYNTPDLTAMVQAIVDRPGWISGNNIDFIFDDNASTVGSYRSPLGHTNAAYSPSLVVVYEYDELDAAPGTAAPVCDVAGGYAPVANYFARLGLTHIFNYDASAGTYSGNLLAVAPPYTLLPAAIGAGDQVYFGIDATAVPNAAQFLNLVFSILQGANVNIGAWALWSGAGWVPAFNTLDLTSNLSLTGERSVSLAPYYNTGTAQTTINGVTGWWVRFNATAVTGALPAIIETAPYITCWNWLEVNDADIPGDIGAILAQKLRYLGSDSSGLYGIENVVFGTRSVARGPLFVSCLNCSNTSLPLNCTLTVPGGASGTVTADTLAPAGYNVTSSPVGAGTITPVVWTFNDLFVSTGYTYGGASPAAQWAGKYRVFLRYWHNLATPNYINARLGLYEVAEGAGASIQIDQTGWLNLPRQNVVAQYIPAVVDMGLLQLTYDPDRVGFQLRLEVESSSAFTARWLDVILIPADEYHGEFYQTNNPITSLRNSYPAKDLETELWINPMRVPKSPLYASVMYGGTSVDAGKFIAKWRQITAGLPVVAPDVGGERIYFLFRNDAVSCYLAPWTELVGVTATRWARYFSMRGNQ